MEQKIRIPLKDRLENNIYHGIDGCWYWLGYTNQSGYGMMAINRRPAMSHRVSYEFYVGPIGELYVLHRCDNPTCINPNHLFLGTYKDNATDKVTKGRHLFGERIPQSKLKDEDIAIIREAHSLFGRGSGVKIADYFKVSKSVIYDIIWRKSWKHI